MGVCYLSPGGTVHSIIVVTANSLYLFSHSFYAVVVILGRPTNQNQADYDDAKAYVPGATYYITAAWSGANITRVPATYVIGNESVTYANGVKYLNAKLSSGSQYTFFVWIDLNSDLNVRPLYLLCLYIHKLMTAFTVSTQPGETLRIRTNLTTIGTGIIIWAYTRYIWHLCIQIL